MILDIAVIALSLAALAYVGRSMLRPRPVLAQGIDQEIAEEATARMPQDGTRTMALSRGRLREALPRRPRPDGATPTLPDPAPEMDLQPAAPLPERPMQQHARPLDTAQHPSEAARDPIADPAQRPDDPATIAAPPLDVLIDVGGPGASAVEVVDLSDPEDVCALEFAQDPTGHLHILHGRAEAELDTGLTRTAWLDVYLSRSDWLDRRDLDAGGEFPDTLATHVLRIDLGRTVTAADGTVTGAINEDPDLYFDRDIASEIEFSV